MTLTEVMKLAGAGESERVEFKKSTGQRSSAAKAICGMLNGLGGHVLFGVTDQGTVKGQSVNARTLEHVTAEIRRIEPPAFPEIEVINVNTDADVIILSVSGRGGPYLYDGRAYIRQGPSTIQMPREEFERRVVERLHATQRWENEPVSGTVDLDDLDYDAMLESMDQAVRVGRLRATENRNPRELLRGFELIRDGKLLNAAVVLFGKDQKLSSLFPQLSLRLARFRGIDRLADFSDNRQYWGNTFDLLKRAQDFLMDHLPIAGHVSSAGAVREDRPLYPPRALREALANALCHRDYSMAGGAVSIAMYDEHLEITNPGGFHYGITPGMLSEPHESRPWNPIIANVFYRTGIIERWGTGTLNMIDWCSRNGNPPPTWKDIGGSIVVEFFKPMPVQDDSSVDRDTRIQTDIEEPVSPATVSPFRDQAGTKLGPSWDQAGTKPKSERTPLPESLDLDMEQIRVLYLAREQQRAITEFMSEIGRSNRTKFRQSVLQPLLDLGLVEMTIPEKPRSGRQRYKLSDTGIRWLRRYESKG